MINSQRFTASRGPAATARERLLQDKVMRRNGANPVFAVQDSSLTALRETVFPFKSTPSVPRGGLSAAEQRRQALQVARSLKGQYLSGIMYLEDYHTTIAIVRPIHKQKGHAPHQICVDAAGNVTVQRVDSSASRAWGRTVLRLLLLTAGTLGTVATLLFAIS